MQQGYRQEEKFTGLDFTQQPLSPADYDGCTFHQCDFSGVSLCGFRFIDCVFTQCNLSLAELHNTSFRDVVFKECKLLGLRFDACGDFGLAVSFEACQLNHSSFYKTKLKKTKFKDCQLHEADFTDCDLSAALLANCDLFRTVFDNTNLEKADLRTAYNYSIDPERSRLRKARFSLAGLPGLLQKYAIEIDQ